MGKKQTTHVSSSREHALDQMQRAKARGEKVRDSKPRRIRYAKSKGGGFVWAFTVFKGAK